MTVAVSIAGADGTDISLPPTDLYIGGDWKRAERSRVLEVRDPSSDRLIAEVADASPSDALGACDAAASSLDAWRSEPPRRRSEVLRAAYDLMHSRAEALAYLISLENGKTLADARGEVGYAAEFLRWFSEEAVRTRGWIGDAPASGNRLVVFRQPIGVAILVTPWNFPAAMATRKLGPALAAGCSVVLKPASATPLTALAIAEIFDEAGLPSGVLNVITTSDAAGTVATLLGHGEVRKLSFTGSTEVGKKLLAQAATRVVSCSMELGGNSPFIVFADADLDAAVAGALVAKMRNGGEACTSANRFYVESPVYEEFIRRFARAMSELELGPATSPQTQCGPLISPTAQARVTDLVSDALDRGARLASSRREVPSGGYFVPPTVLADVPADAAILQDEIFGPVAPVMPFDGEEQGTALANATDYGLISYVYTRDLAKGLRVSEALEAGMVGLNRGLVSDPAAPFGGVKESGLGREGADEGIKEFQEIKYVATGW